MPEVSFRSNAYNVINSLPHFINEHNFGEDLAEAIRNRLRSNGVQVAEGPIGQEDHGWYFSFGQDKTDHTFLIGHVSDTPDEWIGVVERDAGFLASIFGGRGKGIQPEAVQQIRTALQQMSEIHKIVWDQ